MRAWRRADIEFNSNAKKTRSKSHQMVKAPPSRWPPCKLSARLFSLARRLTSNRWDFRVGKDEAGLKHLTTIVTACSKWRRLKLGLIDFQVLTGVLLSVEYRFFCANLQISFETALTVNTWKLVKFLLQWNQRKYWLWNLISLKESTHCTDQVNES